MNLLPLIMTIVVAGSLFHSSNITTTPIKLSKEARIALENLTKQSGGSSFKLEWDYEKQTPKSLMGQFSKPSKHSPEWITYEFLNNYKVIYGLKRPNVDLEIIKVDRTETNSKKVLLQRVIYQTPVCGELLTTEIDTDGVLRRVDGNLTPNVEELRLNRPMYPAITAKQAAEKAISIVQDHGHTIIEHQVKACYLAQRKGVPLVYSVDVSVHNPMRESKTILVHSLTGKVIE